MPKLQETGRVTEAAAKAARETGRLPIQLISPGKGSSGYYSAEVLEQAVADDLFPAGTHMYADHPTQAEMKERPVRSIKDLMSVTATPGRLATEDDIATWGAEPGAIVAEADVLPAYRDVVEHLAGAIGVSIRGDGEINENGEVDGQPCRVVESLAHVQSVDWVTRPGRGGRVLSLVESARATTRAVRRHGVSEATARDTEEVLRTALREAHGSDDRTYVWVRDFDPDANPATVWFEIDSPNDDAGLYAQAYKQDAAGAVTLTGDRIESRVVTTYVPVTRPDSTNPTTTESQEDNMGTKQIEESELTRLTEAAGRVATLESENATKDSRIKELEEAEATRLREARDDRAAEILDTAADTASVRFSARECRDLLADLPLKESALDEDAFTKTIEEAVAKKRAAGGEGTVRGHGGKPTSVTESGADPWAAIDEALGLKTQEV